MTEPHMPSQLQCTTTVTTFLYMNLDMNIILHIVRKTGNAFAYDIIHVTTTLVTLYYEGLLL